MKKISSIEICIVVGLSIAIFLYLMEIVIRGAGRGEEVSANNNAIASMAAQLESGASRREVRSLYGSIKTDCLTLFDQSDDEWIIRGVESVAYASDRFHIYFVGDYVSSNHLSKGYGGSR